MLIINNIVVVVSLFVDIDVNIYELISLWY